MIKPYLKNDLFEGIIGKEEYLLLNNDCLIDKNSVLIAIHDLDSKPHKEEDIKGFKDVLQIHFWDLEEDVGNYKTITKEQGKIIKDFILKHKDTKFLIHCHAGESRSAGVAMAVECIVVSKVTSIFIVLQVRLNIMKLKNIVDILLIIPYMMLL